MIVSVAKRFWLFLLSAVMLKAQNARTSMHSHLQTFAFALYIVMKH